MSTPESTPSVEHGNAGHAHRCSREHRWQHSGPSAEDCALLARDPYNGVLSEADCAVCSGRDDLLTRAPHTHHCQFCDVEWVHEGRCVDGLAAWCPWDFPGVAGGTPTGTRTGRHLHYCPDCRTQWPHHESCAAPFRVVLPGCPGCVPGGLLNEVKRIGGKVGSSLRGEAWEVSRSRRLWGTIAGVSGAILLGLLNEVKRIGGKVGSSLRGEAWEVSRSRRLWGTIAGVSAAILLGCNEVKRIGGRGARPGRGEAWECTLPLAVGDDRRRVRCHPAGVTRVPSGQLGPVAGARGARSSGGRACAPTRREDGRAAAAAAGVARGAAAVGPRRGRTSGRRARCSWSTCCRPAHVAAPGDPPGAGPATRGLRRDRKPDAGAEPWVPPSAKPGRSAARTLG